MDKGSAYKISIKQVFLAHLDEPQGLIILDLDIDTVISACKLDTTRDHLLQTLGLGR